MPCNMRKNVFQKLYYKDLKKAYANFDGIVLNNKVSEIPDIQTYLKNLRTSFKSQKGILISYHNSSWEPILSLASFLGLRKKTGIQNWLDKSDIENLLKLADFKVINTQKRFFGLTMITTAQPLFHKLSTQHKYSVSIIVPVKDEEGNIPKIITNIPNFGKWQEIIFIEGHSTDKSWEEINKQISKYKNHKNNSRQIKVKAYHQTGKGKADAVKLGFDKAKGDILMIYDADMTVDANDLLKFYDVLANSKAKFANGSRMVYPMEKDAMRTLNKIGNKLFGILFSWILGTKFKDTLCGTKALWRKDYIKYKKDYLNYLKLDPFGDFALIFLAIKNKLKIFEIPVRYKERVYGTTNIKRFRNGLQLFRMTIIAFLEFKI